MASNNYLTLITTTFFLLSFFALSSFVESSHHKHNKSAQTSPRQIRKHSNFTVKFGALDRRGFLTEHNKVRKQLGEPPLMWDKQLTRYARRFAWKRINDCRMVHSADQPPFGENIYWGSVYEKHTAADAVRKWAAETNFYDRTTNRCINNRDCGHYKQIAWRASTKVGCARQKCSNGGVYIICNYDPPGNWENENPFDSVHVNQATPPPSPPTTTAPPPPPQGNLPPLVQ